MPGKQRAKLQSKALERQIDSANERYEEAWFNFHRYDKDGSGSIDRTELVALLRDLKLHVGRTRTEEQMDEWAERELKKNDANGDGILQFEVLRNLNPTRRCA